MEDLTITSLAGHFYRLVRGARSLLTVHKYNAGQGLPAGWYVVSFPRGPEHYLGSEEAAREYIVGRAAAAAAAASIIAA